MPVIPEYRLPDDPGESIRRLIANEPAYYAHKDQLFAGYQDAVKQGREPTKEQRHEGRRRRQTATAQVLASARRIVQREQARILRDGT